mgnify:CR=1 FL=1
MEWYDQTAMVLTAIGAINWGLTALGWNAVQNLLGWGGDLLVTIVYYIVALAGLYTLYLIFAKK